MVLASHARRFGPLTGILMGSRQRRAAGDLLPAGASGRDGTGSRIRYPRCCPTLRLLADRLAFEAVGDRSAADDHARHASLYHPGGGPLRARASGRSTLRLAIHAFPPLGQTKPAAGQALDVPARGAMLSSSAMLRE